MRINENKVEVAFFFFTFIKEIFTFIKEIYKGKGVFFSVPKRRRTTLLKMFINEKGNNVDLYNNLALFGVLFLVTSN